MPQTAWRPQVARRAAKIKLTELPPGRNLLETITEMLPHLRPSDRRVAELALRDPDLVITGTMASVAQAAGVSDPTVVRFCAAVGCSSFQLLKLQLAQCRALGIPATHSGIEVTDDVAAIAEKIVDYTITSLDRMRRQLDHVAIAKAVDLLASAKRIEFFGFGASGIIALDAQQKFPLFGVPCGAQVDAHQQFMVASLLEEGDVAFAISNTGRTTAVLEMAKAARRNGAKVIGLTGYRGPFFDMCDVGLLVETLENTNLYTPTTSRIAGLAVIDILATGTALRRGHHYIERVQSMKAQLAVMRSSVMQHEPE
ncbi:MAG: SIS domain-containing protein [Devosia nanyangense]|uniref:SIS domain-containing protein n=1 Tax=Devosia nanyangense TaxID=1228055 RepID=A0A933L531_9HYPH|nr:SIS domain-containing protein [Devosia nanyangense]